MRSEFASGLFAAILVAISTTPLLASNTTPVKFASAELGQPLAPGTDIVTPPGRVGRVSLASGKVEYRAPNEAQWSPAAVNDPIAAGVALRTGPQTRAEIRIGADTIDLAEGTEIAIVKLDQLIAEIAVKGGRVDLDIRRFDPGETLQIDTSFGGVWLQQQGRYDIDAGVGDQVARVAVFTGAARFVGRAGDILIAAGDRIVFGAAAPAKAVQETASGDEFSEWCGGRAVDDARLAAPYFVSREMTGYAELDQAGSWRVSEKYGPVWTPKAPPKDWLPYRDGHWRWFPPWGWSWVDNEPWGFATSHYGRWMLADNKWSWTPGKWVANPVWTPAVVAFLGTPGVGLSYPDGRGPAIAWLPLAPEEIYWPSYSHDVEYIRAVNAGIIADLSAIGLRHDGEPPAAIANAHLANRQFATVVRRPAFTAGQEVATALLTIPEERLLNAPTILGSPQIGPPPEPMHAATGSAAREHPPSEHTSQAAKGSTWSSLVRAAVLHSREFQEMARERYMRVREFAHGGVLQIRHSIVLRVAHSDHTVSQPDARKRVIRR